MRRTKNAVVTTDWLVNGLTDTQLQTERNLVFIAGKIYLRRLELGMDQKQFAKFMGVSQGMISKWESGDYNFTISTIVNICQKLGLTFDPNIKPQDAGMANGNVRLILSEKNEKQLDISENDFLSTNNWTDWKNEGGDVVFEGVA